MKNIAFLFPGQGSQKPGMVRELYEELSDQERLELEDVLPGLGEAALSLEKTDTDRMAGPLVYLSGILSARLCMEAGIQPSNLAGFSVGELAALNISGITSARQMHQIFARRSQAMDEACLNHDGAMAAINGLEVTQIEEILVKYPKVWPVNYNSPKQTVISGDAHQLADAVQNLKKIGGKVIPLNVRGAFHTPYMNSAAKVLTEMLESVSFNDFTYPVRSNLDGAIYPSDPSEIRSRLARQVASPVRFTTMVEKMYAEGVRIFIECGFGKTLQGLVNRILPVSDLIVTGVSDRASLARCIEKLEETTIV